ncbi:hypothetical protein CROQUDRAFT_653896 [Cronartium quercuum f. sp. fusiforme G11]|uniref:Uncharacterized protein n=1 Tax=Cronartium quercuum f. sp. fusiforme G11 TaxID=708437 RepID=A0A9P6NLL3_9BASI|nr:hypothetical protein CROQUDRAFT_653896 [Cronartium quercuum f. sp. fusiforme G11]
MVQASSPVELEHQEHLDRLNLLERLERGESIDDPQLAAELLDDPLDVYLLYVRWALDTFSSDEAASKEKLLPILEKSTRKFVNNIKYRNDHRYLKLWALYARQCSRIGSTKIYEYLSSNQIGIFWSMFYEEWANAIESAFGDLKQVERVYDLGISREAQPLKRLEKRKKMLAKKIAELPPDPSHTSQSNTVNQDGASSLQSSAETQSMISSRSSKLQVVGQHLSGTQTSQSAADLLFNDPLKEHFAAPIPRPIASAPVSTSKVPPVTSSLNTPVLACDLSQLYPDQDVEVCPEELRAQKRYPTYLQVSEPWEQEPFETKKWYTYHTDGSPVLYHPTTGEPLFDYLKVESSFSSEMQLSEDEMDTPSISAYPASKLPQDDCHLPSEDLSMTSAGTFDDDFPSEAVADAEVSVKMDSPSREGSVAYVKSRNRRASVTVTTQAALDDVANMYGPRIIKDSDESDDNISDMEEEDQDYDTGYTIAGVRDATADVTYWSQPPRPEPNPVASDHMSGSSPILLGQRPMVDQPVAEFQDENCGQGQRYGEDPLAEASNCTTESSVSFSVGHRNTPAFKPTRKPLMNLTPVYDENALSSGPPFASGSKPLQTGLGVLKRVPLGEKPVIALPTTVPTDSLKGSHSSTTSASNSEREYLSRDTNSDDGYRTPLEEKAHDRFFPEESEDSMCDEEEGVDYDEHLVDIDGSSENAGRSYRPLRYVPVGDNFNALTPITERASECTSTTFPQSIVRQQGGQRNSVESDIGMDRYSQMGSEDEESELTPRANVSLGFSVGSTRLVTEKRLDFISRRVDEMQVDVKFSNQSITSFVQHQAHPAPPLEMDHRHQLHPPAMRVNHQENIRMDAENERNHLIHNQALRSPVSHDAIELPQTPNKPMQDDEPCNPFADEIIAILLDGLDPPLEHYPGFRSLSNHRADKLTQLQKRCKVRSRKQSQGGGGLDDPMWEVELDGDTYFIYEKLGEGAYGSVFKVIEAIDDENTAMYEGSTVQKAMKVESPPNLYEFSILSQLHKTLSSRLCTSVIAPHKLYAYADESFMILDYSDQGTLLDIVNRASEIGISPSTGGATKGVDELLAIFFVVELMRVVEGLHEAGFIHGDLKIDNCLVRLQGVPGGSKSWSSVYDPEGGNGWEHKGLKLIDYGRSIDTSVFPAGQQFIVNWETDEFDCEEMRTGKPWTFQPDYHGIVAIAHCLLFGSFMTEKDSQKPAFRRYHQCALWSALFDACLRPEQVPNQSRLRECRLAMETWLKENCERNGKSLKGFLKKIEVSSLSR